MKGITMKRSTTTALAIAAVGALGIAVLAGCSSSSSSSAEATASAAASAAASASPSGSMVGTDPSTWAPVEITPDQNGQIISLKVGQHATFLGLPADDSTNRIVIESSNPLAVEPTQQGTENGVTSVAGLTAVGMGASHILVWDGDPNDNGGQVLNQYIIQVFDAKAADDAPGSESPTLVKPGASKVSLVPGEFALVDGLPAGTYTIASDNEMVAMAAPDSAKDYPGLIAVGDGIAKVTISDSAGKVVATIDVTSKTAQ